MFFWFFWKKREELRFHSFPFTVSLSEKWVTCGHRSCPFEISGSSGFAHIISRLLLALLYSRSHGWRRSCRACGGQWKRNVQGRLCRWWCSTSSFPIHCWPAKDAWNHGWHGPEGQLCRRRGAEQARCADLEVSHWARHRHQLGWHGALLKST